MTKGILGRKIGMTQLFSDNGELIPVTVIEAEPNVVLQKMSEENNGYEAIQIGYFDERQSRTNKAKKGHAEKANTAPKRYIREIRHANLDEYEVGQEISVEIFEAGEKVDVTGTSKGKGYQGTIKRHNQARGPSSHGSRFHRAPGSIGSIDAARVFKGQKMAGQMGSEQVTVQNLEIVNVDTERNLLLIKGSVPGARKSVVKITSAVKGK